DPVDQTSGLIISRTHFSRHNPAFRMPPTSRRSRRAIVFARATASSPRRFSAVFIMNINSSHELHEPARMDGVVICALHDAVQLFHRFLSELNADLWQYSGLHPFRCVTQALSWTQRPQRRPRFFIFPLGHLDADLTLRTPLCQA